MHKRFATVQAVPQFKQRLDNNLGWLAMALSNSSRAFDVFVLYSVQRLSPITLL